MSGKRSTGHRDVIRINGLEVDCVVGVYPHERNASQPLLVDIEMVLDTEPVASRESLRDTADYGAAAAQVRFLLRSCQFRLLETAAHAIAKLLLAPPGEEERRSAIQEVMVRLTKPGALRGFAVPSLEIRRDASWCVLGHETKAWGRVAIIHETRDAGIYRLDVAPSKGIPLHIHREMRESEMVLTKGILCQGAEVDPGTVHRWPRGAAHRYDNPTDRWQSILCVDMPRFLPHDEIEVTGEPADVPPEPPWGPIVGVG
ncbi:MAG: dihydroneopterin aldolase [Myxococcota bacterium]